MVWLFQQYQMLYYHHNRQMHIFNHRAILTNLPTSPIISTAADVVWSSKIVPYYHQDIHALWEPYQFYQVHIVNLLYALFQWLDPT